jgi:hypothetical protein
MTWKLNVRKRFVALSSQELKMSEKLQKLVLLCMFKAKSSESEVMQEKCNWLAKESLRRYCNIVYHVDGQLPRPIRLDKRIASFTPSQCWNFFETRQGDLPRLLQALRMPVECRFKNGARMVGEEVMLRGLYELVSGEKQFNIAENVFGREQSMQSRAFKYFILHVYRTFFDLVHDNLQWWWDNGFLHASRDAITARLRKLGWNGDNSVGWFIDCNCLEVCRVGGGPRGSGPNATRWACNIQKAFYNGWKSIHGLKHQTVDIAHGFTIDMYGPTSVRRNDLRLLGLSRINERMAAMQVGGEPVTGYGDSIYPHFSHMRSCLRVGGVGALDEDEVVDNDSYKSVRISIEWNYMNTSNLFRYLKIFNKLRVMKSTVVCKIYILCTILRNCHIALYGGISSNYFDIFLPSDMLEKYMGV